MAKTLVMFDSMKLGCWNGAANLSGTYRIAFLSDTWSPSIDTSTVASLTSYFCTQLSGNPATKTKQVPGVGAAIALITKSADGVMKFDLSDMNATASSGLNISARYGLLYRSAGTVPSFYWEISTTAIAAAILNITWPSPCFETSDNV